jgi:putative spermidine/putrescine transport system ATP-binding protein
MFDMEKILEIRGITKEYRKGEGVFDMHLDINKGELVTLLGPSGCGKTTLLRCIGGFVDPDDGDILINGKSIINLSPEKRPTAMVFQSYNLWPNMTVYGNLAFGLKLRKIPKDEIKKQIDEILKFIQMPDVENKYPSQLSGGQQQRVAVARALLLKPQVLLLDEPFSALDAKLRLQMREELRRIQVSLGVTMIFVTHDQEEALSISDRIVVMNKGHIEQLASSQEVYDTPASMFAATFVGKMNFFNATAGRGKVVIGDNYELPYDGCVEDDAIVAVRPEDMSIEKGDRLAVKGKIVTVMSLGHYVTLSVESQMGNIKIFLTREALDQYLPGDEISLAFNKFHVYESNEQNIKLFE